MENNKSVTNPKVYGLYVSYYKAYFKSEEELLTWAKNSRDSYGNICEYEYIGDYKGKNDVLKMKRKTGEVTYYCPFDSEGYYVYNPYKSRELGKDIWEYKSGSLEDIYEAFRQMNVTFTNDIYGKTKNIK